MNKIKNKLVLILLLIIPYSSLFAKPLDEVHKVVVLKKWEPYYFLDKNGKPQGYAIDLFEKIASNIDLKYEYIVANNWKELWKIIKTQQAAIIPNVGVALKRSNFVNFTQTTDIFEIGLYKNTNQNNLKTTDDIKNRTVGVVLQNVCTKLIDEQITDHKILFHSYYRSLAALSQNEIDLLCYPKPIVEYSKKQLNINNIESFGRTLKVVKRAIGVTKNEKHLLELFDEELLRIKGNGQYQEIYDKWFVKHKDIELDIEQLFLVLLILIILVLVILYIIRSNNLIITKKELDDKIKQLHILKNEQLEQQKILLTQSKIAAVGEMLGNIAHQWRQPLSIITTNVSSLQLDIEMDGNIPKEKVLACADDVIHQSKYLSKTIDDFRKFFQSDSQVFKKHNLNDVFDNLQNLVKATFTNNFIQCKLNIHDNISLKINDNLLIQALINICNNSKDALIENKIDSHVRYFIVDIKKLNNSAVITFKDSAGGIEDDVIDKIFEPYFTTKHQSVGTGIGLYMTYQIITKHLKGTIEVANIEYKHNNKKLKGAMFTITLPIVDA